MPTYSRKPVGSRQTRSDSDSTDGFDSGSSHEIDMNELKQRITSMKDKYFTRIGKLSKFDHNALSFVASQIAQLRNRELVEINEHIAETFGEYETMEPDTVGALLFGCQYSKASSYAGSKYCTGYCAGSVGDGGQDSICHNLVANLTKDGISVRSEPDVPTEYAYIHIIDEGTRLNENHINALKNKGIKKFSLTTIDRSSRSHTTVAENWPIDEWKKCPHKKPSSHKSDKTNDCPKRSKKSTSSCAKLLAFVVLIIIVIVILCILIYVFRGDSCDTSCEMWSSRMNAGPGAFC